MPLIALSDRSHLHLAELQRVMVATPSGPDDAGTKDVGVRAAEVQAVEMGK